MCHLPCFQEGGADFAPGGANFGPPRGELGGWFLKKNFQIHNQNFINFLAIYCTFLYKIWGSDDFGVAYCAEISQLVLCPRGIKPFIKAIFQLKIIVPI